MVKSKTYTKSKQSLNKNQTSKFCLSDVTQTDFQNLKEKGSEFFFIIVALEMRLARTSDHCQSHGQKFLVQDLLFATKVWFRGKMNLKITRSVKTPLDKYIEFVRS